MSFRFVKLKVVTPVMATKNGEGAEGEEVTETVAEEVEEEEEEELGPVYTEEELNEMFLTR